MNNSDETSKKSPDNGAVLQAVAELAQTVAGLITEVKNLSGRFDKLENFVTAQFDAVQDGIAYNSAKFDRFEAKFYDVRPDVSNVRADIKELTQVVRKKELV